MENIVWNRLVPTLESEEWTRKKILVTLVLIGATTFFFIVAYFWKYFTLSLFLSKPALSLYVVLFSIFCYALYEPFNLQFTFKEIYIPGKKFKPFVAVHLSDLHLQWPYPYVTEESLKKVVQKVNDLNPDIIFLTGDYISRFRSENISAGNTAALARSLSGLKAKNGVYAILGNNDFRALKYVLEMFEKLDIRLLRNETVVVGDLIISGIDPAKNMEMAKSSLDKLPHQNGQFSDQGQNPENALRILLSHEPDVAVVSSQYGFDLQLSGHSHGGQCVAPFGIGPLIVPTMGWRFPLGLYKVKDMLLFVSAGVGISPLPKPPVRFNNPPEVAVLRITN
ncbi:Ser/Thr protein phosphatase [Tritrichomonas foetus]|uniref:Ser/Thr protein phosphatase n=1 Tax=Tritrichomonas foetus TaxID=1144522 RepID=A0A1J4K0N0_9EUKA|nr:Ser/Thr protein phosphatase [Tritrichomonas foetus]|eukprot:OHT03053.1 Ser/Thr protein phosphatase [Tritrichomonas foetus]